MKAYYRRPEETAGAFSGGWFHTGDLAYAELLKGPTGKILKRELRAD